MSAYPPSFARVFDVDTPRPPAGRNRRLGRILGGIGEALLTLGIVLALFVVWELWWTDVGANRHQRALVESLDWATPAIVTPVPAPSEVGASPQGPTYRVVPDRWMERVTTPPDEAQPAVAETFATLYVPRWGYDYLRPVSEGVNRKTVLDPLGIGHYPHTALPGGWGNFAVAGHRTTFGKPFSDIETLQVGDALIVRTENAWYVYHVTATAIVSPEYAAAIAPVPGDAGAEANGRYITLTTCHPRFSAANRYVVYGILDYWAPAWAGYPPEVVPPGAATIEGGLPEDEGTGP